MFFRKKSTFYSIFLAYLQKKQYFCSRFLAAMVESVDTKDLKSFGQWWLCGFKSRSRYWEEKVPNMKMLGTFALLKQQPDSCLEDAALMEIYNN